MIDDILQERGRRYGDFATHAKVTQNIKRAMQDSKNWPQLSDSKKEALEMVAHKLGRILNGDSEYRDSWDDLIGYLTLVIKEMSKSEESNNTVTIRIDKIVFPQENNEII